MNAHFSKQILWLIVLLVLLVGLGAISYNGASIQQSVSHIPPPTASDLIVAQDPQGFQAVISYTDRGFEPHNTTILSGETVRFSNNSSKALWVAGAGGALYPAVQDGCGSSALDSCHSIDPGQYWQFTFTQKGTWGFENHFNQTDGGVVIVQ